MDPVEPLERSEHRFDRERFDRQRNCRWKLVEQLIMATIQCPRCQTTFCEGYLLCSSTPPPTSGRRAKSFASKNWHESLALRCPWTCSVMTCSMQRMPPGAKIINCCPEVPCFRSHGEGRKDGWPHSFGEVAGRSVLRLQLLLTGSHSEVP